MNFLFLSLSELYNSNWLFKGIYLFYPGTATLYQSKDTKIIQQICSVRTSFPELALGSVHLSGCDLPMRQKQLNLFQVDWESAEENESMQYKPTNWNKVRFTATLRVLQMKISVQIQAAFSIVLRDLNQPSQGWAAPFSVLYQPPRKYILILDPFYKLQFNKSPEIVQKHFWRPYFWS